MGLSLVVHILFRAVVQYTTFKTGEERLWRDVIPWSQWKVSFPWKKGKEENIALFHHNWWLNRSMTAHRLQLSLAYRDCVVAFSRPGRTLLHDDAPSEPPYAYCYQKKIVIHASQWRLADRIWWMRKPEWKQICLNHVFQIVDKFILDEKEKHWRTFCVPQYTVSPWNLKIFSFLLH